MKKQWLILCTLLLTLLLTACGDDSEGEVVVDVALGEQLYNRVTLGPNLAAGCVTCHAFDASEGDETNAPFTSGTGSRAATRVPGLSAADYIRESILSPDAFVVEGYSSGTMYQKWSEDLTESEIESIVAYLLEQ